ncbi:hypothetical protein [Phenylobacterium sp.]|uniref:hypothetical protein n=1 Tax=Phenylobacterium sp. TaxID=1871053 RepID=UPI003001DA4A
MAPPSPLALFWASTVSRSAPIAGFGGVHFTLNEAQELRRSYLAESIKPGLDDVARAFCRRCAREIHAAIRAVSPRGCD